MAAAAEEMPRDPIAVARMQSLLRFATGITIGYIISEAMEWYPTFLVPVFLAMLLTSLPIIPPLKTGLTLVAVLALAALVAFVLPSLLGGTPQIMFGILGLIVFLAFLAMAHNRAKLPALLLLICVSTIPVLVLIAPAQAGLLPIAMVRAMAVAFLILWCMYGLWPQIVPRTAQPAPAPARVSHVSPVASAMMSTAIVIPVMLFYLMFGLADALPVLVTTVLLLTSFDPREGAMQGVAMMLGNLLAGLIALAVYTLLGVTPNLLTLALLIFLVAMGFAIKMDRGGSTAAIATITFNSTMIILSASILSGSSNPGIWLARLTQVTLACAFAIGMMSLVWGPGQKER